jgi:hypothetical protein
MKFLHSKLTLAPRHNIVVGAIMFVENVWDFALFNLFVFLIN